MPDPEACLEAIAASTRTMKKKALAASFEHVAAWVAMSGLFRILARRQRMMNLFESDLTGPPVPLYVLGARILEVTLANNFGGTVGLSFAILSYAGQLNLSVSADAERFPDLRILMAGMERNWVQLSSRYERVGEGSPLTAP
jgi:hypothetical protein